MEADTAILVELETIIEMELTEVERRIQERVSEVIAWELKEGQRNIRRELVKFMVALKASIKRVKEESSVPVYDFIPAGKGSKKTLVELIQQRKDEEKNIGELI